MSHISVFLTTGTFSSLFSLHEFDSIQQPSSYVQVPPYFYINRLNEVT